MEPEGPRDAQAMLVWPFTKIFSSALGHQSKIAIATARLSTALQADTDPIILEIWKQRLEDYTDDELQQAFTRAERELKAFPAPAHLVDYIERSRFHDALAVVLAGLARYGAEWKERPAYRDYVRVDGVLQDGLWHPAEEPPKLSQRMVDALCLFGHSLTIHEGLLRLKRDHPRFWSSDHENPSGKHGQQLSLIERDLYACWMEARG